MDLRELKLPEIMTLDYSNEIIKQKNPRFFIHIPKNGGMSLRWNETIKHKITYVVNKAPFKEGYGENLDRIMKRLGEDPGYQHCRIRDLNVKYWNIFQPFSIVRNPWDRVASRYFFAQKVIYHETNSDHYHELDYCDCKTFEAFLEERHKWGNKEFMWHRAIRGWYNAVDYMKDQNDKIICDVIRFENYQEDINKYLDMPNDFHIPPRNVTALNKGTYIDIYTPKTAQIVADWYKEDIEYFGYTFQGGATKNYWNK
tara:strand:+ start:1335 stop:2102 length:768 start_codon:yes stop_codon:yes gene_type:complete